ncbi:MAG: MBL fold metallo-hydrolase [Ruminococcaceae bacterium]|nr:MBL fold metallo-hydrolase [Oscillospiraceae bacterium]
MKIIALKYGESVFGESHIFDGGRGNVLLPITFTIYLIQTENKNILIDAGCDDGAGFEMSVFKRPVEVLGEYGLTPDDITDVVITHAHHDHVAAVGHYKKAIVHIQKDEYPEAKRHIPEGFDVNLFEDGFTFSEKLIVRKIGGHSIGSCIVLADSYVLCGDECYYKKCLTDKINTGYPFNREKSVEFIQEYSDKKYIPLLFHDVDILKGKTGWLNVGEQ